MFVEFNYWEWFPFDADMRETYVWDGWIQTEKSNYANVAEEKVLSEALCWTVAIV